MTMRDPRLVRPRPFHPAPEPVPPKPKPHIDDVVTEFHKLHGGVVSAMHHRAGSREQEQAFNVARDKLRLAMRELGLYDHIDWSEK